MRLKSRWRDGTTHILMERSELLDRLVPLIPPPRAHQVRYHGILAPCASRRDQIVPGGEIVVACNGPKPGAHLSIEHSPSPNRRSARTGPPENILGVGASSPRGESGATALANAAPRTTSGFELRDFPPSSANPRRHSWAALLQLVFGIDALRCHRCESTLRLIAAIEDPAAARKILECLKLSARAPPLDPPSEIDEFAEPAGPCHLAP